MRGICQTALIIGAATSVLAGGQQGPRDGAVPTVAGSAVISGVVATPDPDARPVRRAIVTLSSVAIGVDRMAVTGDDGRFVFPDLPAGRFTLVSKKAAWVTSYFGGMRPGRGPGTPIALADGQRVSIRMTMLAGAVIAGVVRDHLGQACAGDVRLLESRVMNGVAMLTPVASSPANPHDGYRFFGLAPGTYFVVARNTTPPDMNGHQAQSAAEIDSALRDLVAGRMPTVATDVAISGAIVLGPPIGYGPTFYPRAVDPALATPIIVAAGEERGGVDLTLQRVPAATFSGVVVDPAGHVPQGLQLAVISPSVTVGFSAGYNVSASVTTRNGAFSRDGQTPGHYSLFARAADAGDAGENGASPSTGSPPAVGAARALSLWGTAEIDLDGHDITNVTVTLQRGMTVAGRLAFDASTLAAPRDLTAVQLKLTAMATRGFNLSVSPIHAKPDGTFEFTGVPPGRYLISVIMPGASGAWTMESAASGAGETLDALLPVVAERNITDLVVTMTDRPAVLSGSLLDRLQRPAPEYTVVVFSTDKSFWTMGSRRVVQQRPAHDGKFVVTGLPPGDYYVGAVTDLEGINLADAAFLETLAAMSARVTLTKGATQTLNLAIGSAGDSR